MVRGLFDKDKCMGNLMRLPNFGIVVQVVMKDIKKSHHRIEVFHHIKSCIEEDRIVGTTLCHSLRYTSSCDDVAINVNSSPGIEHDGNSFPPAMRTP